MKLRYLVPVVLVAAIGISIWQVEKTRRLPPEIPFTHVTRQTIISSVPTDGKVEPLEWAVARAERPGAVKEILIKIGQHVSQGQELVRLDTSDIQADRATAQSNIAQIQADLQTIGSGGRPEDLARYKADIDAAQLSLKQASTELVKYQRMEKEQIATPAEVTARKQKVDTLEAQIKGLQAQKAALVSPSDRTSAEARLQNAQAALTLADQRLAQSVVRAPIEGEIYQFDLKQGAYLNAGDPVATIGVLNRVKVTVNVDERDLGRVSTGMPVQITWDALPGQQWMGEVNKLPEQIVAKGSRQVGEVGCVIENPLRELLPGTNVNVQIKAEAAENALTIPKEALRTQNGQEGVYLLRGDEIQWRPLMLGIDSATRIQVKNGLSDGDAVALITDRTLKSGMKVTPAFP